MTQLGHGLRRQLHLLFASRLGLSLTGLLVVMSLVTGAVYQQLVIRHLPVGVLDLDNSRLSRTVRLSLEATPELSTINVGGNAAEDFERHLVENRLAGYILIPEGFSAQVKQGKKATIVVGTDMSNLLAGKTLRAAVSRVTATLNVGAEITLLKKLGTQRHEAVHRAYPIVVEDNQLFNPATNYAEYLVPMVLFFLLHIYATVLFSGTWLDGKTSGLVRIGELALTWLWSLLLGLALWLALPWCQVSVASSFWLGALCVSAYLIAQCAIVAAVSTLFGCSRMGFQIVLFFSMLGLMLSGVTWPTHAFPPTLAKLAEYLPFTHLAQLLRMTVHFEATLDDVTASLLKLMRIAGFSLIPLAMLRLARLAWPHRRRLGDNDEAAA